MLIIVFLYAVFNLASSAPVLPSTTNLDAVSPTIFGREVLECVNVARYRTIQDIVWSCLATIFACTWVAVHPNVPRPQDSKWKKFCKRILVMVFAILVPEFVIVWALRQWRGAVRHAAEYNQKYHGMAPPSSYLRPYIKGWFFQDGEPGVWTITHGFLLEMHGLEDDSGKTVCSVDDEILEPLDISEEEINDKSKGDFLTKTLVVLQTTWFIFQCLARWMTHLPVTQLEVVTLTFALLNIGTYALWWNKPQGMGLAIQMSRYRRPGKDQQEQKETVGGDVGEVMQGTPSEGSGENTSETEADPLLEGQPNQQSGFLSRVAGVVELLIYHWGALIDRVTQLRLRSEDIGDIILGPFLLPFAMLVLVDDDDHIFYASGGSPAGTFSTVIIGTVFGGLHLVPLWTSSFPSSIEKYLWKMGAILITIQPFLISCLIATGNTVSYNPLLVICVLLVAGLIVSYLLARIILVVLAFTTLRDLPRDAFRNVAWTTFLPHF